MLLLLQREAPPTVVGGTTLRGQPLWRRCARDEPVCRPLAAAALGVASRRQSPCSGCLRGGCGTRLGRSTAATVFRPSTWSYLRLPRLLPSEPISAWSSTAWQRLVRLPPAFAAHHANALTARVWLVQGDTDVQAFLRHAVMRSATAHMLLRGRQCLMSARAGQGRGRRYVAGPRRWRGAHHWGAHHGAVAA